MRVSNDCLHSVPVVEMFTELVTAEGAPIESSFGYLHLLAKRAANGTFCSRHAKESQAEPFFFWFKCAA